MRSKALFLIAAASLLVGCATIPPPVTAPQPAGVQSTERRAAPETALGRRGPDALFHALAVLGVDYRWGGNSREQGFDCSGLVAHVYREAYGIQLPRNTQEQSRQGRAVERSSLEAGDLVFYNTLRQPYSHVGIYLGDGRFIHAPRTGSAVRVEKMSTRYWTSRFDGARRILD